LNPAGEQRKEKVFYRKRIKDRFYPAKAQRRREKTKA